MHRRILGFLFFIVSANVYAQFTGQRPLAPQNDICAKAITIEANERLSGHSNEYATLSLEFERPEVHPKTCIQTIENDVWFRFEAKEGHIGYEVSIAAGFCSTPTGLQALIIKADGCKASEFVYRACSNKINTDTIKLYLEDPEPGQNYFIWIDGYDGTFCEFDVTLKAREELVPEDYRFLRFDYDLGPQPPFQTEILEVGFANNSAELSWSANSRDDASLFIIELMPAYVAKGYGKSGFARVVGFVDPRNLVGEGESVYHFIDYITPFKEGKTYYYRLVKIAGDGTKEVTETFSIEAKLVQSFYVGQIRTTATPGSFIVTYVNRKKNQTFDVSVEDTDGQVVKQMQLKKEPVRDGEITINMAEIAPGEYFFIMSNGKDAFKQRFIHHGK